ncbi:3-hydroxyacyl-CoA dehydrogenase NAD-binding domain-containing protein, partial [Nesterenkonia natronophila]|uniref:3-hydroxyacyl-CoA dehydrogenase NAD-binding domain-containing protein n=1 Tax=Nesterenkonia natronophila TaxID=2174932 RepID=UPI0021F37199
MSATVENISVIGTGYLGATHAACMAELGFNVVGVDIDPEKITSLSAGDLPFHEPGLPELIRKHVTGGKLRFTTNLDEVGA